jgi:hypothetical protein
VRTSVCLLRSRFQEENQHLKAFEDLLRDYLSKNSKKL